MYAVCFILSQPHTCDKRGWHLGRRYTDVAAYAEYAKQLLAEEASGFQLVAQECHRAGERPATHPESANDGYCAAEEAESSAESIPPVSKSKAPGCVGLVAVDTATGLPFGESSSRGHASSQEALAASHGSRVLTPLAMVYSHCTHARMHACAHALGWCGKPISAPHSQFAVTSDPTRICRRRHAPLVLRFLPWYHSARLARSLPAG